MSRTLLLALFTCCGSWGAPKISFVRQFGGSSGDSPRAIARDKQGNVYVAGDTQSNDFPANTLQLRPGGSTLDRIDAARAGAGRPPPTG